MLRDLTALVSLATAIAVAPAASLAQCGAGCDKPISRTQTQTSYQNKHVVRSQNVTRYRDVDNTKHVTHTKRIVTVTRVQPVTRVHVITRVHHRTKILRVREHVALTRTGAGRNFGDVRRTVTTRDGARVYATYRYRTVRPVRYVTRYRDVYRTRYVTRINQKVASTKVRRVVRVRDVAKAAPRNGNRKSTIALAQSTTVAAVKPRMQMAALNTVLP